MAEITVNAEMLVLARESRGLTQADLAKAAGISQGKLSKYENGMLRVIPDDLHALARVLNYSEDFFGQSDKVYGLGSSSLFHRQRQSAPMQVQRQVQANVNVLRMQVDRLLRGVEIESANRFEPMDVEAFDGDVERIAGLLRVAWKLPLGPIRNLTDCIEGAGGVVFKCAFGTGKIDAAHLWLPGLPPLFFINGEMSADRYRFTLAHELGHAIMHRCPTGDIEDEANRFAAEFLMPKREIAGQLSGMSIQKAGMLKPHWGVSMAALIRRARDTEAITTRHYHTLCARIGALGYKTNEPIQIPAEEPKAFRHLVEVYRTAYGYTDKDFDKLLFTNDPGFFSWHGMRPPSPLKIQPPKPNAGMRLTSETG